jgi:sensor c-di-GMP phosphodiesterase-like protein
MRPHLSADKNLTLSFNVSPAHFATPGFDQALRTRVAESKVSFRQIAIEITERQPLENLEAAVTNVRALQELGFKISIDDVGIGHSGLSHVQSLGADTLKIDKFFVDTIDSDSTAKSIVEMLVRLAARLDMSIIAEGIELDTQADALRKLGVTQGQGFLVSRPMPMDDFIRFTATPRARARAA